MRSRGLVGAVNGGLLARTRRRGWRALVFAVAAGFSALWGLALAGSAVARPSNCAQSENTVTCNFGYTGGAQTWTVPAGVTSANFDVQGAQGGNVDTSPGVSYTTGGLGGEATADLRLIPGATVIVVVGGQGGSSSGCGGGVVGAGGFNGGAPGGLTGPSSCPGGGGGGASDVRIGRNELSHRILVAGGGGGAANAVCILGGQANGGAGGGLTGEAGSIGNGGCGSPVGGSGGNQTGTSGSRQLGVGSAGSGALAGGGGGGGVPGGGGGGGYYGGAGGGDDTSGGGGSGFGSARTTFNTGVRSGDGVITVSYRRCRLARTSARTAAGRRSAACSRTRETA
jgi:Glycine rich protein